MPPTLLLAGRITTNAVILLVGLGKRKDFIREKTAYTGHASLPRELIYNEGKVVPGSPLINLADRLVVDAIRRASLTNRPSVVKYPPDYFNNHEEHSSSSSEDEAAKKKQSSRKGSDKGTQ